MEKTGSIVQEVMTTEGAGAWRASVSPVLRRRFESCLGRVEFYFNAASRNKNRLPILVRIAIVVPLE